MAQKIAIVEDDATISQMYRMKFESEGYEVEVANGGTTGFELVKDTNPDIVLLDLMMPDMNGDEMLAKMREEPWGKHVKVIILTNMGEQEAPPSLKGLGVLDFIVKAEMTPRQVAEIVKQKLAK